MPMSSTVSCKNRVPRCGVLSFSKGTFSKTCKIPINSGAVFLRNEEYINDCKDEK